MKRIFFIAFLLLFSGACFCQAWTANQLDEANTAADIEYLSVKEKQVVQYINLCRMFPKQFATNEVVPYKGIPKTKDKWLVKYKATLVTELNQRKPCDALEFDDSLYVDASCYAKELSKNKRAPHQRLICTKYDYAECVFFGTDDGRFIALEWLIDSGVEDLGHRKICLDPKLEAIGIKILPHFKFKYCAVGEYE